MSPVSIKEGKNRFSELVRAAESGESTTITRNGHPVCKIVPCEQKGGTNWAAGEAYLKSLGVDRLITWVSPDFDDPLPEDFLITPLPPEFDIPKASRRSPSKTKPRKR